MPNTAIETSPLTTEADRALAAALIGLPSVRAVSLGGSRALGLADATSDTDLYAWFEAPLDASALRQAAIAGLADGGAVALFDQFGPEDKFAIDGRLVEIVYLDLADINASIEAATTVGLDGEVCATAFLHTAARGVPLADPDGALAGLRDTLQTYPEATRAAQFANLPPMAEEFGSQLRGAQRRGDVLMVARRRAALIDVVASLTFALNRRYHPGEKRLAVHLDACALRPDGLVERLQRAATLPADDPALPTAFESLIAELVALGN